MFHLTAENVSELHRTRCLTLQHIIGGVTYKPLVLRCLNYWYTIDTQIEDIHCLILCTYTKALLTPIHHVYT